MKHFSTVQLFHWIHSLQTQLYLLNRPDHKRDSFAIQYSNGSANSTQLLSRVLTHKMITKVAED